MERRKKAKQILFSVVILILVLVILYSGLRILESTVLRPGKQDGVHIDSQTIVVDGVPYFPRQDITVILVLGIDRFGPAQPSGSYTNPGAADVDVLVIFDETRQEINMLYLNRDTMLTMPVLGLRGQQAGTWYGQLALAHTYGSGMEDSCVNSRNTISAFLGGVPIDYYVSMNMDVISMLTDAVGGVTVEVTEDFSAVDPTIGMGMVTLDGRQALNFVRTRKDVGDQLNLTRMERQKAFMASFAEAFQAKRQQQAGFALSVYSDVEPFLVTDSSARVLTSLLDKYGAYSLGQILSPKGENVMGEQYYEFYVDKEDLQSLVLKLFYEPKP